jgi:hypothetical protein
VFVPPGGSSTTGGGGVYGIGLRACPALASPSSRANPAARIALPGVRFLFDILFYLPLSCSRIDTLPPLSRDRFITPYID